ncbi:MAG TPA: hypothetical protein VKQ36_00990, partial [Ktedonobacterales bacterium]|nr:hypothetical protein [Ktedonobacterales bacterium]
NTAIPNLEAFDPDMLDASDVRLCVGCVNTQSADVESVATLAGRIASAGQALDTNRLWLAPDCGLRTLPRDAARTKLTRLAEAAQERRSL